MDLYMANSGKNQKKSIKYRVKPSKAIRKAPVETDKPWRTREEFAKEFIHALDDAQKFLRGEIELKSMDDLLEELKQYVEEEKRNGRG